MSVKVNKKLYLVGFYYVQYKSAVIDILCANLRTSSHSEETATVHSMCSGVLVLVQYTHYRFLLLMDNRNH